MKKVLITTAIVIVSIVVIMLIIALFAKKEYTVKREITINKPKQEVFNYIRYLKNQDNFSKWNQLDPAMKKEYSGTDGTVGFKYAWDSKNKNAGKGEQQITQVVDGDRLDVDLHFIKPFEGRADASFETTSLSDTQTKVTWGFHSKLTYPMNLMLVFMDMDEMLGSDLQEGLNNLKGVLENK